MVAVLLVLFSIFAGWQVVRLLPLRLKPLEVAAASVAVGFVLVAWLVFLAAAILGFNVGLPLILVLALAGAVAAQFKVRSRLLVDAAPYNHRYRWLARAAGAVIVAIVGYMVVISYQFPAASGAWLSNGNVWGDAPLHVGLANQFAHGNRLDLVSPVYMKVPLTYPLIADFYSGVLLRVGGSWTTAMMLPTLMMMLALLQLVFTLGYRLLGSALGAWLQFLMLVFSGSLRGAVILTQALLSGGLAGYHQKVGTSLAFATGDNYLNFIHSHPLPQRSYLFGMPLLILVALIAIELYRRRGAATSDWRQARIAGIIGGVLIGLMPLVHSHSFLVVGGVLGLATVGQFIRRRRMPAGWWWLTGVGLALALPQLLWQFSSTYDAHFTKWIWGWMMQNFVPVHGNWFWYWFVNVGGLFVTVLAGWVWLRRLHSSAELWLTYVAGVAIFLICNVYVFQPSQWDNMKFFEYAFWAMMIVTAAGLAALWRRSIAGKAGTIAAMVTLCLMGFYTLVVSGPRLTFELLSANEVAFGEQLRTQLPADAFVLVGDRHNHPVTMLADRKVLMTFSGWYNLYDAKWPTTLADRTTMLSGGPDAQSLISRYGLTHAVFSDAEVADGSANLGFYQTNYRTVGYQAGWWTFDLRSRP